MKSTVFFAVTTVVLAALCVVLWTKGQFVQKQTIEQQPRMPSSTEQQTEGESKVVRLTEENRRLRQQLGDIQMDLMNTQAGSNRMVLAQQAAKTKGVAKSGGKGMTGMLKEMMDDPEMRKGLMQQQKMAMDMVYGPMIKELGLSAEEADKFKELLVNKQMDVMSMAGDGKGGAVSLENQKKIADQQKEADAKIKELLGDKRFAQYQDYNETIGERMAINQFATQTSTITADQKDQLLAIIKEEKKRPSAPGATPIDPTVQGVTAMQSDEAMEKLLQQQSELNSRVLERSRGVLSEEQFDQLASFQTGQINMQRVGMQMARKMMGGDDVAAPPASTAPQP
ncbi:MAG: hypothetical protein JWM99_1847 [Verrucomicrobiales bacterium]|nr:hypothetical protein [Verrucomicrobiales bacterium]